MSSQDMRQFLGEVEELIEGVLERRQEFIPEDLHSYFLEAWPGVRSTIMTSRSELLTLAEVEQRLVRVGLTGSQLALKLTGFRRAFANLKGSWERRLLKKALGWANLLLGSLNSVLPGGEAIKEFKEAIEKAVDEGDE